MKHLTKYNNLSNKTVLLMGLGLNGGGLGAALYLAPRVKKLIITDLKTEDELKPSLDQLKQFKNIQYTLGQHRIEDFVNSDIVFKGAGIKLTNQYIKAAIENNVIIETDIGYFFELADFPIIGITGSKGKSTTTTLIHEILSSEIKEIILGGNIAISPLTSLEKNRNAQLAVLELSSWQLFDLSIHKKSPNISVLTTIFPDHLNYYSSMEEYYKDKKYIFKFQKKQDFTILNINNDYLFNSFVENEIKSNVILVSNLDENDESSNFEKLIKSITKKFSFCLIKFKNQLFIIKDNKFSTISDEIYLYKIDNSDLILLINSEKLKLDPHKYSVYKLPSIEKTFLYGEHNKTNILLSICAALIKKIKLNNIYKVIESFSGPEFRLQTIRQINDITFINDTTATVPDAVASSIEALKDKGRILLIAGGVDKKLPVDKMVNAIFNNVYKLYLLEGNGSDIVKEKLNILGYNSIEYGFNNLPNLVNHIYKQAEKNDIILLSPGFASFNLFVNEFDRGRIFNKAVSDLK